MKSLSINYYMFILFVLLIGALSVEAQAKEDTQVTMKADKTGTNPINFRNELRFYNEFQWLKTGAEQNISTFEFRAPFKDGKWQFRTRVRGVAIDNGMDEGGFGDMDFRFLTVPYLDMSKKMALAVGFETFLDTASKDSLGSGTTSLGPQAFAVFFKPFGGFFDLIAPAYQHKFSVEEDSGRSDVEQGFIDVFALKMSKDKQSWLMINPTFVLDYENNQEYILLDFEVGTMLDKYLGTTGHSFYVRPGVSIGGDRPTDVSIEMGYKIVF